MRAMRGVVGLGLVIALFAAGCGGDEGDDGPIASQAVARASAAFAKTRSFHLVYDLGGAASGSSGLALTHADGDVEVAEGVQKGIDLDGLLKDPLTGTWRELDVAQVPGAFFDLVEGVPAVLASVQSVERVGDERVAGVDTYHVRGKITARKLAAFLGNTPSDELVPVELWVGHDDSLIRRIQVNGPVEAGDGDDVTRTVDLSSFGKSVQVER